MIIDISLEITKCKVYPGDPKPVVKELMKIENGDMYNLSMFSMCAHNGTHVDAPAHFLRKGKTIDQIPLNHFVGECYVCEFNGELNANDAFEILKKAKELEADSRILIKGDCVVSASCAKVFSEANLLLIGNESITVGPFDSPMEVHKILLEKDIVLLEGINLSNVNPGKYFLAAQPLNIKGIEGSPCRAILIKE